jgi:hypothetical protein
LAEGVGMIWLAAGILTGLLWEWLSDWWAPSGMSQWAEYVRGEQDEHERGLREFAAFCEQEYSGIKNAGRVLVTDNPGT